MLFGSLSISGAAIPGIPSTMLSVLPIISAIFALIGGIIAFNQSKWGALFLFIAMGLCAPSRDTWLYGGLYFFAGLFCFFLRKKGQDESPDIYDDYEQDDIPDSSHNTPETQDFYYADEVGQLSPVLPDPILNSVVAPQPNNEPPKLRRRMSKSCPECGAVVSRDAFYCPTCGAKLFVISDDTESATPNAAVLEHAPNDEDDIQSINDQLFTPPGKYEAEAGQEDNIPNMNDGDDDMGNAQEVPNYRVAMRGKRSVRSGLSTSEVADKYTRFSKQTNKAKKPKRSAGRKVLSILLLLSAVGGSLYFLLGLRKLPPGELPPMVRPEVITVSTQPNKQPQPLEQKQDNPEEPPVEPSAVAITENMLPDFAPERTPSNGAIIGSNVNVRADHTTSSNRVTRLNVGTRVEVLGTFNVTGGQYPGIWYNIRTGGRDGWVYGKYVQPLGSGLPAGYSNALMKSFGSTKTQLIESLGKPTRSTSSSAEWPGLTATLRGEDITRIRVTSASRELQNGLKPGMSQTALQNIMGYPSSVNGKTLNYNEGGKTGLSVQLDKNNAISTITVSEVQ